MQVLDNGGVEFTNEGSGARLRVFAALKHRFLKQVGLPAPIGSLLLIIGPVDCLINVVDGCPAVIPVSVPCYSSTNRLTTVAVHR